MDHRASASVLHSCLFLFFFFNYLYVLSVIDLNSSVIELKQFSYIHGAFLHLVLLQLDKECLSDQRWSVVRSPCSLNVYRVAFTASECTADCMWGARDPLLWSRCEILVSSIVAQHSQKATGERSLSCYFIPNSSDGSTTLSCRC